MKYECTYCTNIPSIRDIGVPKNNIIDTSVTLLTRNKFFLWNFEDSFQFLQGLLLNDGAQIPAIRQNTGHDIAVSLMFVKLVSRLVNFASGSESK